MSDDILFLPANEESEDIIVADLHGGKTIHSVLELANHSQTPQKVRIFFCGDYIDKGPFSMQVVKTIIAAQENKNGPRVYAVCGNHEREALNAIDDMQTSLLQADIANPSVLKNALTSSTFMKSFYTDPAMGSGWLIDLFVDEVVRGKITINKTKGSIEFDADSEILLLKEFIKKLPYLIRVSGKRCLSAFKAVHARSPLSDAALLKKAHTNDKTLTEAEKSIAINTRVSEQAIDPTSITCESITYAGHNNLYGTSCPAFNEILNLYNLDFGAYITGQSVVVNHTTKEVSVVGSLNPANSSEAIYEMQKSLHMQKSRGEEKLLKYIYDCADLLAVESLLEPRLVKETEENKTRFHKLYVEYIINNNGLSKQYPGIYSYKDYQEKLACEIKQKNETVVVSSVKNKNPIIDGVESTYHEFMPTKKVKRSANDNLAKSKLVREYKR